jgi:hypothetical protein
MKAFLITIMALVGVVVLGFGLRFVGIGLGIISLPIQKLENKVEFNADAIDKTYSLEYCLANYEWFKDTYQDIQQSDGQIRNKQEQLTSFEQSAGERATWTFEDKQQYNTLSNEVTGLKNYRLDLVGKYNSRTEQLNRIACKELPLFVNL